MEDAPEIHEMSAILVDYFGFVKPSYVAPLAAPIAAQERTLTLRTIGMAKDDDVIFNTPLGRIIVDFVSRLSSKLHPDSACWDLSQANPQALAHRSDRLRCVREVGNLFAFDFGPQATVPWRIAVTTPGDVLTVCRMDPNDRDITIARSLFRRGIPFRTLVPLRSIPKSIASTATECMLPYRLSGYIDSILNERCV